MLPNAADVHYNLQTKKEILSCQFYIILVGETFHFLRDVCKLQSVVNFESDISMLSDAANVHYNFQTKKRDSELSILCQFCW